MSLFKGSGVAIVTPFTNTNAVNYEKLGEMIDWHIANSTDAIIICGTTGEASTMSKEEKKEAIKYTIEKVNGRIPVIAGTGSNNTAEAISMSVYAESVGADGLLVVTPYYNKTTQKGLLLHYQAIANSVKIPIILYNVPGRTAMNLMPETVAELAKHPNIQGLKEACGDISQVAETLRLVPEDFYVYSGNDDQIVPILALGGKGVISVVANIMPKETHDIVMHYLEGRIEESKELQISMLSLIKSLFIEPNPIPVKTAMNIMGFEVGELRLPLAEMDERNVEKLVKNLRNMNLVLDKAV